MSKRLALSIALLLSACGPIPRSPVELSQDLNRWYPHRPANEFFYQYGLPAGKIDTYNGGTVYRWVSDEPKAPPAPQPVFASKVAYHPNPDIMVDTYHSATQNYYCELRIYTDWRNQITGFAVAVDSMGRWSASRCTEIFGTAW